MSSGHVNLPFLAPGQNLLWLADGLWAPASDQAHADFEAWCAAHPGQRCTLWVGGARVTDLVCEAGAPLAAPAARVAWARRVLMHYRGQAAGLWPLLPWRQRQAWGACALDGLALADLQAQAQKHRVKLLAVRPLWPVLLERLMAAQPELRRADQAQAWLLEAHAAGNRSAQTAGATNEALLTCVTLCRGHLMAIRRRRLQAPWPAHMQALIDEDPTLPGQAAMLLCVGANAEQTLPLGVSESLVPPYRDLVPRSAARGPDFLAPMPRPGAMAWAWLATSAVVLGLAGLETRQSWELGQAANSLAMPATPRPTTATPAAPIDRPQQQRLLYPWQQVFKASETPAAAGLNWLALDHQVDGDLRLQGVAQDAAVVQRVAARLRAQPAWRQVLVSRLEVQSAGLSFEIVARMAKAVP